MYDITKGQLWALIIGGFFLWIMSFALVEGSGTEALGAIGIILIPVATIFYILGWRRFQGDKAKEAGEDYPDLKKDIEAINTKITRITKKIGIPTMILILIGLSINFFIEQGNDYTPPTTSTTNSNYQPKVAQDRAGLFPIELVIPRQGTTTDRLIFGSQTFQNLGTTISNSYTYTSWSPKKTDGKFMEVEFSIENNQRLIQRFDLEQLALIDEEGRQFPADKVFNCHNQEGEYTVSDQLSYSEFELKPGIPCKFNALFEVADDVEAGVIGLRYRIR